VIKYLVNICTIAKKKLYINMMFEFHEEPSRIIRKKYVDPEVKFGNNLVSIASDDECTIFEKRLEMPDCSCFICVYYYIMKREALWNRIELN